MAPLAKTTLLKEAKIVKKKNNNFDAPKNPLAAAT